MITWAPADLQHGDVICYGGEDWDVVDASTIMDSSAPGWSALLARRRGKSRARTVTFVLPPDHRLLAVRRLRAVLVTCAGACREQLCVTHDTTIAGPVGLLCRTCTAEQAERVRV